MVVFLWSPLLWKHAFHPLWEGSWITFVFKCSVPLLTAATEPSVTTPAGFVGSSYIQTPFFFVCPVFSQVSEAAWWNIEVQLAASRHWGNRKGIKTFTLWHCWEQMPFDVKAIGSAERNKNLIILIMSDSQICKHTQFNMCAWENFSFSPLIFLTLSLRLSLRLSCLFFWLASYRHSASLFTAE